MRKIAIYGIGQIGKKYVDKFVAQGISKMTLTDSNSVLWGTEYDGMQILNPDEIAWLEYALVIVTVSDKYKAEICKQSTRGKNYIRGRSNCF